MSSINPGPVPDPIVFPDYRLRRPLRVLSTPSLLAPYLPAILKSGPPALVQRIIAILLLFNIRSFPLFWHIRVFLPAVWARFKARPSIHPLLPWISSSKHATTQPGTSPALRLDALPLGKDIFNDVETYTCRAWPDDCDWNLHVSNSAYSRALDYARMSFLSSRILRFHFDGGWMALGGAALTFHKEIPFMAKYEIRMQVASWDDKWFYVLARFVSPAKGHARTRQAGVRKRSRSAQNLKAMLIDVAQPQGKPPVRPPKPDEEQEAGLQEGEVEQSLEGRTIYATAVSRYCFKSGRRTIPPWLVVATSGYGTFASTRSNWERAEGLRRNILSREQAKYQSKHGKAMPRDGIIEGGGHRKAGIMSVYDPARAEGVGKEDNRGLGAWQDKASWNLGEFEERRLRGLEEVRTIVGGVLPSSGSAALSISRS
ncbi:hypothetical protein IE81DRAFT_345994 [Ceraceosorus guamensis]|uniref:Thioesterase/thiol ester dehydrase-isomerase n=1 Tax=Ceraceosorus guamensis TaxID=1522189 RepID=A0A316W2V9_9BASI|nr:hypothetical protein IE81DRAFT_345994 [Ceraceosorus guamensis]PWN44052.1 hypothetical protein IE81DRAFT_345994 [Ceraceosorus guamensis]